MPKPCQDVPWPLCSVEALVTVFRQVSSLVGLGQSRVATEGEVLMFLFAIAQYLLECVRSQGSNFKILQRT